MSKIRITEPGFEGYTGLIAEVRFENGVAEVNLLQRNRLGACFRIVDAETDRTAGPAQDVIDAACMAADVVDALPRGEGDGPLETQLSEQPGGPKPQTKLYTEDELADIADKGGIAAIREISAPMGVKGKAIADLIAGILKTQEVAKAKSA